MRLLLPLFLVACQGPLVDGYDPDPQDPEPDTAPDTDPGDTDEPIDTGEPLPDCTVEDLEFDLYAENHAGARCNTCPNGDLTIVAEVRNPCHQDVAFPTRTNCVVEQIAAKWQNQVTFPTQFICTQAPETHIVPAGGSLREDGTYTQREVGTVTLSTTFGNMERTTMLHDISVWGPEPN